MIKLDESLVDTYVIGIHNQVIIHEGQRECVHKHCCTFAVEQQCTPSQQTLGERKRQKGRSNEYGDEPAFYKNETLSPFPCRQHYRMKRFLY